MAGKRAAKWIDVRDQMAEVTVTCRIVDVDLEVGVVGDPSPMLTYMLAARPDTGELVILATGYGKANISTNDPAERRHEAEWPRLARLQAAAAR
jgi:hypothetical protein